MKNGTGPVPKFRESRIYVLKVNNRRPSTIVLPSYNLTLMNAGTDLEKRRSRQLRRQTAGGVAITQ